MRWSLVVAVLLSMTASTLWAQTPQIPPEHHQWAKYRKGAWRKIRTTIETIDEK
jgi:hypothetical protein